MKFPRPISKIFLLSALIGLSASCAQATDYFVSNFGSDANRGTSPSAAWQSVAKVNNTTLRPGDRVYFQGGQTFNGGIVVRSSGTSSAPIEYSSYGEGRATLRSGGAEGLFAQIIGGIIVSELNFVGNGYLNNTAPGIHFRNVGRNMLSFVRLSGVEVSGYGAQGVLFSGNPTKKVGFNDVAIDRVSSHDNKDTGICFVGQLKKGATTYSHSNIRITNSLVYRNRGYNTPNSSGNGIQISDVNGALIERCVAYENGKECTTTGGGPVGIWSFDSNNVVIQYCESHHNGNAGLWDGGGFDIDGGNTNCIIQYCYSHDNEGAGYLVAQFYGATRPMNNNTVRYNISIDDATRGAERYHGSIHVWNDIRNPASLVNNTYIYNNFVYSSVHNAFETTESPTTNTRVHNNIFYTANGKPTAVINQANNVGLLMAGNCYYSTDGSLGIRWAGAQFASLDALRAATGQEMLNGYATGWNINPAMNGAMEPAPSLNDPYLLTTLTTYQLQNESPLRGAGINLQALYGLNNGGRDFYGNALPAGSAPAIGAHQLS